MKNSAFPSAAMPAPELLAPAGSFDAACAAFDYGADAVYFGLKQFSARASAENFTLAELDALTAYAHALVPRRSTYLTLNTLILEEELDTVVDILADISDSGIDAVIVQDLGIARVIRTAFPHIRLHASTQMAIHNSAGARTLNALGFQRVVCARELAISEITEIAALSGMEVEVFIHGALCYSYSGLCLYSSLLRGNSGNRGKCTYPCRDLFSAAPSPAGAPEQAFLFSMKDLALPDELTALRRAGVRSFKIEGRKKSPLYVAATTAFYRRLIDGNLSPAEQRRLAAEIRTTFARPWTSLYLHNRKNEAVTDTETVGHRGVRLGSIEKIRTDRQGRTHICLTADRAVERHDGLSIELGLPGEPFGFPLGDFFLIKKNHARQAAVRAPAGAYIEVRLPPRHPRLSQGMAIFHLSSQAVKRAYPFLRPRPQLYRTRYPLTVRISVSPALITISGAVTAPYSGISATAQVSHTGTFLPCRKNSESRALAQTAFAKLGETEFYLKELFCDNSAGLFVPVSLWNTLRRDICEQLNAELADARRRRRAQLQAAIRAPAAATLDAEVPAAWSIKTDRPATLSNFTAQDYADIDEVIFELSGSDAGPPDHNTIISLARRIGAARVRLALPVITRAAETAQLKKAILFFAGEGFTRWQASNLSAWTYLTDALSPDILDLTADWPLYTLNHTAAEQLFALGVRRFTCSPEDGLRNIRAVTRRFPRQAVSVVYQDTPLFISETAATTLRQGRGNARGGYPDIPLTSSQPENILRIRRGSRTIVINSRPFYSDPQQLAAAGCRNFRVDFINRTYTAAEAVTIWRTIRSGICPAHAERRRLTPLR
ncbi:MAG: U32 family peptidase [Candidatus Omnitrophica bacterium]|nr:U32 family peptidase [Candidatus Omnitrophota bacterium]